MCGDWYEETQEALVDLFHLFEYNEREQERERESWPSSVEIEGRGAFDAKKSQDIFIEAHRRPYWFYQ